MEHPTNPHFPLRAYAERFHFSSLEIGCVGFFPDSLRYSRCLGNPSSTSWLGSCSLTPCTCASFAHVLSWLSFFSRL